MRVDITKLFFRATKISPTQKQQPNGERHGGDALRCAPMPRILHGPMRALAKGLFDTGAGIPEQRLDWMLQDADAFLSAAGPKTGALFVGVMAALESMPVLLGEGPRRFSRLSPPARARYLERLERSRLSALIALPKAVLGLVYYEHPDAAAETGYDGDCMLGELPEGTGWVQLNTKQRGARP